MVINQYQIIYLTNMDQLTERIILKPWFYVEKTMERTKYCFNHKVQEESSSYKKISLITLAYVGQDCLSSLANIIIQDRTQDINIQVLAYASLPFAINNQHLQMVYIPAQSSSCYSTIKQALSHILKYHSQHTLTPSHLNHLKPKMPLYESSRSYILIHSNEIYEVNYQDNRMELIKKIQLNASNAYNLIDSFATTSPGRSADLQQIEQIMTIYFQAYDFMLNSSNNDRNWINYTTLVLGHSYLNTRLQSLRILKIKKEDQLRYLSVEEMGSLQEQLQAMNPHEVNSGQHYLFEMVCRNVMKGLRHENQLNFSTFLQGLKNNFDKLTIANSTELDDQTTKLNTIFQTYKIQPFYLPYITQTQKLFLQTQHQNTLLSENKQLKQQLTQLNSSLSQKQHQISQYHQQIYSLQHFRDSINHVKLNLKQICDKYEQKQQECDNLSAQLEGVKLALRNSKIMNEDLESRCGQLGREKKELYMSIREMTKEHLNLMTQIGGLKEEIKMLQDKLEESEHIEARALSSIQNQAEIKVRLNRYQNYVDELKHCMHTFKKLQIQKFNYILAHNAKEFKLLKQSHQRCKKELLFKDKRIRQLQEVIECQKLRIDYFQKMYISNYHNDTIYQVSEENSATDREINAN